MALLTPEQYEAKRQARYERFIAAAEKAATQSAATWKQASLMADVIPFGQPILVGHHSEKRDRNYRARIESKQRKGYELHQKAEYYRERAESAASNDKIMSDNPSAVNLLQEKVQELKAEQAEMKRINAALRHGADFATLEMNEAHRADLLSVARHQAFYRPLEKGFPPYAMTSINARIKAAEARAAKVEKMQAAEDTEKTGNGITAEYSPSENRIRLHFPEKQSEAMKAELKRHGYRWAPSQDAYSAYYNWNAKTLADKLTAPATDATPNPA